jgi:hypothetical protein
MFKSFLDRLMSVCENDYERDVLLVADLSGVWSEVMSTVFQKSASATHAYMNWLKRQDEDTSESFNPFSTSN